MLKELKCTFTADDARARGTSCIELENVEARIKEAANYSLSLKILGSISDRVSQTLIAAGYFVEYNELDEETWIHW